MFKIEGFNVTIPEEMQKRYKDTHLISFDKDACKIFFSVARKRIGRPFESDAEASKLTINEMDRVVSMYGGTDVD